MVDEQSNNLPAVTNSQILNKTSKSLGKIIESRGYQADEVPHLDLSQIRWIIETVQKNRHGDRDALLVRTIFDGCFRCSEAIGIRPRDIVQVEAGWQVNILGKGQKWGTVAISASLAAMLQAYAYRIGIKPEDRIFPINRTRSIPDRSTGHASSRNRKTGWCWLRSCPPALRSPGTIKGNQKP